MRKPILLTFAVVLLVLAAGQHDRSDPGNDTGLSKHVVIVHETSKDTPEIGATFLDLRDGEAAKYFAGRGVSLEIIDRDAMNESSKRIVDAYVGTTDLPGIFFFDKRSGKLKYSESLGKRFTADSVVSIAKKRGA